jgi:hypothetical protein
MAHHLGHRAKARLKMDWRHTALALIERIRECKRLPSDFAGRMCNIEQTALVRVRYVERALEVRWEGNWARFSFFEESRFPLAVRHAPRPRAFSRTASFYNAALSVFRQSFGGS